MLCEFWLISIYNGLFKQRFVKVAQNQPCKIYINRREKLPKYLDKVAKILYNRYDKISLSGNLGKKSNFFNFQEVDSNGS